MNDFEHFKPSMIIAFFPPNLTWSKLFRVLLVCAENYEEIYQMVAFHRKFLELRVYDHFLMINLVNTYFTYLILFSMEYSLHFKTSMIWRNSTLPNKFYGKMQKSTKHQLSNIPMKSTVRMKLYYNLNKANFFPNKHIRIQLTPHTSKKQSTLKDRSETNVTPTPLLIIV